MPEKKHLRGVSENEQRQYEHVKEEAEKQGRYRGRKKEVAARTVLKQHKRPLGMKRIVVGYDGSDAAERALERAADIAQAFSAQLSVVSASRLAGVPAPTAEAVPPAVPTPVAPAGAVPLPCPHP